MANNTFKIRVQLSNKSWSTFLVDYNEKATPHFAFSEIANLSATEEIKLDYSLEAQIHMLMMEELRVWYNKRMIVSSGHRTVSFNKKCGGTSTSLHLKCCACDIALGKITESEWKSLVKKWTEICTKYNVYGEIGRYSWGVHFGSHQTYYKTKRVYEFDKR